MVGMPNWLPCFFAADISYIRKYIKNDIALKQKILQLVTLMQMYKISLQNQIYKSDTNQKMAEPILNKMMTGRANKADACSN